MTTFHQRLRLARGLRWRNKYPPMPWREMFIAAIILGGYLLAQYVTDLGNRNAELAELAATNEGLAAATLHCMNVAENNERGYFYWRDAGLAFECGGKLSGAKL